MENSIRKYIFLSISFSSAPLFFYFSPLINIYLSFIIILNILVILKKIKAPGRKALLSMTMVTIFFIFINFRELLSRDAGIPILIAMSYLKLFELKTRRDWLVASFLNFFIIISMILYSSSIYIFIYILASSITTFSVMRIMNSEDRNFRFILKKSALTAAKALPFCIILFFLFPRIQGNLWTKKDSKTHKAGLASTISPGMVSSIAENDELAFQIKMDQKTDLYFRAVSFSRFDGTSWYPDNEKEMLDSISDQYTIKKAFIILQPLYSKFVPSPGLPINSSVGTIYSTKRFLLYSKRKVSSKKEFEISYIEGKATLENPPGRYEYLLPYNSNMKTYEMAKKWKGLKTDEIIKKALNFFKKGKFIYTLNPPRYGKNYIDDFIFEGRKGFCEHFASSFAFMMRSAGVPSRLIGGYLGGEKNEIAGILNVRQKNAHVWCEVWVKNRWIRIDPTDTAIMGDENVSSREAFLDMASRKPLSILRKILKPVTDITDAVNFFWNQNILTYNFISQKNLLYSLGIKNQSTITMVSVMIISITALILLYSATRYFLLKNKGKSQEEILWEKFQRKMKIKKYPHEGFMEYIKRINEEDPHCFEKKKEFIETYVDIKYGDKKDIKGLRNILKGVEFKR